jgi:hypothetical protein
MVAVSLSGNLELTSFRAASRFVRFSCFLFLVYYKSSLYFNLYVLTSQLKGPMDAGLQGGGAGPRQHPIPTTTAERLHLAQLKKCVALLTNFHWLSTSPMWCKLTRGYFRQEFIQKMEEQRRKQGASASVADTEMQASITLATLRCGDVYLQY